MSALIEHDPWLQLLRFTRARIALGRVGMPRHSGRKRSLSSFRLTPEKPSRRAIVRR